MDFGTPERNSTYENDPDSSLRKEGKRVPQKLTRILLSKAWAWLGGEKSPKKKKKKSF